MTTVEVLVLKGAMPSSVAITFDVLDTANRLRRAAGASDAFSLRVSGSGARATRSFAPAPATERTGLPKVLVVPGLGLTNETAIVEGLARRDVDAARKIIAAAASAGVHVATSCSGAFLVASAGLLDGRRATTTWWLAPVFRRLFPAVRLEPEAVVVSDGNVTTAGAALAQIDLMLTIVARYAGPAVADGCARYMLLDARRSQSSYMTIGVLASADEQLSRAEAWARERLEDGITVDEAAAAAGLAPRTFARRLKKVTGLSPVRFLQRVRTERALELLQSTRLPFEEIARRVGYAEASTLRRLLRAETEAGPREMRASAQHRTPS